MVPRRHRRPTKAGRTLPHEGLMLSEKMIDRFRVPVGKKFRLKAYDPGWTPMEGQTALGEEAAKEQAQKELDRTLADLAEAQELLYANDTYAVLVLFQGMDASGKDSTTKHVLAGLNPQGCQVVTFKQPSDEELNHTFLWRCMKALPERGRIGIFNRSYYEDVLVVRVHPELLARQHLPPGKRGKSFWQKRYDDIRAFERHLVRNSTVVLKFFLNLSKKEQKRRFLERLENPAKHWKFSASDIAERAYWGDYRKAYEAALGATSTPWAPWYVIPADQKWVTRTVVADILTSTIRSLGLGNPEVTEEQCRQLAEAKKELEEE